MEHLPGSVSNASDELIHVLSEPSHDVGILLSPFYRQENWDTQRLSNLPKVGNH